MINEDHKARTLLKDNFFYARLRRANIHHDRGTSVFCGHPTLRRNASFEKLSLFQTTHRFSYLHIYSFIFLRDPKSCFLNWEFGEEEGRKTSFKCLFKAFSPNHLVSLPRAWTQQAPSLAMSKRFLIIFKLKNLWPHQLPHRRVRKG